MSKLSIITVNLNNDTGLRKTIESVICQTNTAIEFIIIDGGSSDGSRDIIKEFTEKIAYWVSEPDSGIYNAMNKGILKATGEYCLFLNSGDWLADENVVADFFKKDFHDDIVLGDIFLVDSNNTIIEKRNKNKENFGFEDFYIGINLYHQAMFIKKKLFDLYGLYNEKFKIVSDFEFLVKTMVLNNASYNHFDRTISYYFLTGISSQEEFRWLYDKERDMVFMKQVPLFYKSFKKIYEERESYKSIYNKYMKLKHSKLGFLLDFVLFLNTRKNKFIQAVSKKSLRS
jgi:glycosyltransferase involved in cell wall biosynthesis